MNLLIQLKQTTSVFLATFGLACVGLAPRTLALLPPPPPDGGYAGANTAEGTNALFSLTSGVNNNAFGFQALYHNTTASFNTAIGTEALYHNTTGSQNTAIGYQALQANVSALGNTATGSQALFHNTTGTGNTATGFVALQANISASGNTATGYQALSHTTTGSANTAIGSGALVNNTSGTFNTAIGAGALQLNTSGSFNIAVGDTAGSALTGGSQNIYIGSVGAAGDSQTIRIGGVQSKTYMSGIGTFDASQGEAVYYLNGRLGYGPACPPGCPSSERFKDNIKPMDKASEVILALKPVTFRFKKEFRKFDPMGMPQFGLIAEEVEKVNRDLITRDRDGKPYAVRYEAVNAMLLNEFLKEDRKVQEQEATITELKSTVAQQQKGIDALTAGMKKQPAQIQTVSAQLELSKSAPQTALNNQ